MRQTTLYMLVSSLVAVLPIAAQQPISIPPNARMRISAPTRELDSAVAVVVEQRGDSLTIRLLSSKQTLTLNRAELSSLEVSRAQHRHPLKGAGIGLVVGAALGGVIGFVGGDDECTQSPDSFFGGCFLALTAGQKAAAGAVGLGATGALIGAIVGAFHKTDVWSPIQLRNVVIAPTFASRKVAGFRLGYSLPLGR